jgi:hypothetical protein
MFQDELQASINVEDAPRVAFINPIDPITSLELAVKAPVTEMVELRVKPGNASALGELDAVIEELKFALQGAGAYAAFRGKKDGDEMVSVMVVGQDSVQVCSVLLRPSCSLNFL